jgi:hypothetical protein
MASVEQADVQGKPWAELVTNPSQPVVDAPLKTEWKAGRQEYLIILSLAIVVVMASLDSSIFLPVLPVSLDSFMMHSQCFRVICISILTSIFPDDSRKPSR